jgi:hypothetical protein
MYCGNGVLMRGGLLLAGWFFVAFVYAYGWCYSELAVFLCMHSGSIAYGIVAFLLLGYMHMEHSIAF